MMEMERILDMSAMGQPRTIKITVFPRMGTRKKAMPLLDGTQINMRRQHGILQERRSHGVTLRV